MASSHLNPDAPPFILRSTAVVERPLPCYQRCCFSYYAPNPNPSSYPFYYHMRWSQFQGALICRRPDIHGVFTPCAAAAEPAGEEIKEPIIVEEVGDEAAPTGIGEESSPPVNSSIPCSAFTSRTQGLKRQCWRRKDVLLEFRAEESSGDQEGDYRTTVMLKNIPNKFGKNKLLGLLDEHCRRANEKLPPSAAASEFDFIYLPMDFKTGCNYGYAFVNFTTAAAVSRLYGEMHRMSWATHGSSKICEVTYARIQGLKALLAHFKKSVFTCEDGEYRPSQFTPSRNGVRPVHHQLIGWHLVPKKQGA